MVPLRIKPPRNRFQGKYAVVLWPSEDLSGPQITVGLEHEQRRISIRALRLIGRFTSSRSKRNSHDAIALDAIGDPDDEFIVMVDSTDGETRSWMNCW